MIDLIGTTVEVGTVEAVYEGKLVEINEYELHLETESGWVVVPVERVAYVREKAPD
jgi:hypothetical protein